MGMMVDAHVHVGCNAQLAFALVTFSFCTVLALYMGKFDYDDRPSVRPYKDTGFLAAPDWSSVMWPNYVVAVAHGSLLLLLCAAHPQRLSVFRRLLLLAGIAQLIQTVQDAVTRLPDPNEMLKGRLWAYTMYPVQYSLGAVFFQFYATSRLLIGFAWALSIFGLALLVPTHAFYTVGILSGVFAGLLLPMIYHWYVRSTSSIAKRRLLAWFERDAIRNVPLFPWSVSGIGAIYPQPGWEGEGTEQEEKQHLDYLHVTAHEYVVAEFTTEHFHYPTFCGTDAARCEAELVLWVHRSLSERQRKFLPPAVALAATAFAGGALLSNLLSVHISDLNRPIGVPLPEDVIHMFLPDMPDHTADAMLYIQLGLVALFSAARRERFVIARRAAVVYGVVMFLRSVTVPATFLPDPSPVCAHRQHPPGTTCGDLIFSGHTVAFVVSALVVRRYVCRRWFEAIVWLYTFCGLVAVVGSRLHYTRDVVTALLVTFTIDHLVHVAIFWRPDRHVAQQVLRYFEADVYILLAALEATSEAERGASGSGAHAAVGASPPDNHSLSTFAPSCVGGVGGPMIDPRADAAATAGPKAAQNGGKFIGDEPSDGRQLRDYGTAF